MVKSVWDSSFQPEPGKGALFATLDFNSVTPFGFIDFCRFYLRKSLCTGGGLKCAFVCNKGLMVVR